MPTNLVFSRRSTVVGWIGPPLAWCDGVERTSVVTWNGLFTVCSCSTNNQLKFSSSLSLQCAEACTWFNLPRVFAVGRQTPPLPFVVVHDPTLHTTKLDAANFSSRSVFPIRVLQTMLFAQAVPPGQQKRSFYEVFEPGDAPSISNKRQRVENARQIRSLARDQFRNTLSKVWLAPRALREFDRRNAAQSLEQTFTSDLERQPREKSCVDIIYHICPQRL
jgi:hypothetical protein